MADEMTNRGDDPIGRVIGTEDATPLEFWVGVGPDSYIQLDDVIALERHLPGGEVVEVYGTVGQVRARHEGARSPRIHRAEPSGPRSWRSRPFVTGPATCVAPYPVRMQDPVT